MADNENVWTQEIEDEKLAQLLNKAATTGHPEWDYHVRHGLASGDMSEKQAIAYLEKCFNPPVEDDEDDEEEAKPAPKKAPTKG